jgi:FkbM family methyltransferase
MKNKIKKNIIFPKITSIKKWLRRQTLDFIGLLKMMIHYHRYPLEFIKAQSLILFANGLIFPVTRIFFGGEKAYNFRHSFSKSYFSDSPTIVFLPFPLKSKIIMRCIDFRTYSEIFFEDVYFQKILRKGINIVDIGAHIGMYTILAAEKVGDIGKVISVEPEPRNYEQLKKNIELNKFKNVITKNIALSDHEGLEKLYLSSSAGSHSLIFQEDENSSCIDVPVKTLDKLLEELDIKKVDIIKIDAEGSEIPILEGAEKTLKNNSDVKIIVASYHYPSETEDVRRLLNKKNFKVKICHGGIIVTV